MSGREPQPRGNSPPRQSKSHRRPRSKRNDEAPLDVQGLEQQGSDPAKRSLVRGKLRNSPMTQSSGMVYDSEAQMAEDMVTNMNTSPEQHRESGKTSHSMRNGGPYGARDTDGDDNNGVHDLDDGDEPELPATKEDDKGGSCRCVIA